MADYSFVIFAEHAEVAQALSDSLVASGHANVVGTASDREELLEAIDKHQPQAVFLDLGYAPHLVLDITEELPAPRPQLIVSGPQDQSDVILRALKQGAREFLPSDPSPQQVCEAIERLLMVEQAAPSRAAGNVIAVLGTKGGVGATVVACQLAASLQRHGGRTAIVDLNSPLGDVALNFDVKPAYTLADIAKTTDKIDSTMVDRVLQRHASGLRILAAPSRVEEAELVQEAHVHAVLDTLREKFDWVIVDVSRSWNEASLRAIDIANEILLVALQDVPTLSHARAYQDLLLRLGQPKSHTRTVVNRHSKSDAVSDDDVARFLGATPDAVIPNDYANAVTCVNEGRSIFEVAPNSELCAAFESLGDLAHSWSGSAPPRSNESSKGFGSRIRSLIRRKKNGSA